MRKVLSAVLSAVIIGMCFTVTGCDNKNALSEITSLVSSNKSYVLLDDNKVDKSEILSYESPYKDACAAYYKDGLNDKEKELYNIFVYAYEHNYTNIKYYSNDDTLGNTYKKIVQCICAENPFVDWNQKYTYTFSSGCYEFTSTQLERKDVDLKIQAYNKAKQVLQTMPQNLSAHDKAEWIYSYIVNNITYVDNVNTYLQGTPSFIYDGIIGGKTQCTGFSDTMTMMCNLAGIETITVCGKTDEGHAWNLINLDGQFYYCDATSDSVVKSEIRDKAQNLFLSFLKSDDVFGENGYKLIDDVVIDFPKAADTKYDLNNIDFDLANLDNDSDLIAIAERLISNKNLVRVHLKEASVKDTQKSQAAASYMLTYMSKNMAGSGYRYVTIKNLVSESSNDVVFFVEFQK